MEYGLWNLHGGFWAGSNPRGGDGVTRSLYNSVNASSTFHGCSESGSYRSQPEFVAMKPAGSPSKGQDSRDRTEQHSVMPLQIDMVAEHSSVESISSLPTQASLGNQTSISKSPATTISSRPENSTMLESHKKGKVLKQHRKDSFWVRGGMRPEALQYLNQQYNPMYSMMFGRLQNLQQESDPSEDEDQGNEADSYSNPSSPNERSSPHLDSGGGSVIGYECGECGLVADTRPGLRKHIALCHPSTSTSPSLLSKLAAGCPMASCRFRTTERDEMESHVTRHVAEGFSPATGKKRAGPVSLQRVRYRYEREEYRCHLCAYTCTIEKAYFKHLKLHALGLNVPQVKISCVICGKDRPSEVEMNKHMRKHRDDRYFCCDICIFRTVQLKKLIQHRRMHTGEKPHLCPHCAYRSARRDNLRSHVRRVHKKDNLFCDTFSPRTLVPPSSEPPIHGESASPSLSQD